MSNMTAEFAALRNLLSQVPDRIQKRVVVNATKAAAIVIRDDARSRVPVKSGKLKKNIAVQKVKNKFTHRGHVKFRVYVKPKAKYAGVIEWGTSTKPAQPYMRPTFANSGSKPVEAFQASARRNTQGVIDSMGLG